MKKRMALLITGALVFGLSFSAFALPYTEQYDGSQVVLEDESYYFYFDFTNSNPSGISTDSSLALTNDVVGVVSPYDSAELFIGLWSKDDAGESTTIDLTLWAVMNTLTVEIADYVWNNTLGDFEYSLTADQLVSLNSHEFAGVAITASSGNFGISTVSMTVDTASSSPVPEPGTMLLLGSGLVGLAGYGRKRKSS